MNIRLPSNLKESPDNSTSSKMLYHDTLQLLSNNGLDATRKGGSNGKTTYQNSAILSLLKSNTAFIRKGKGVKVVKKENVWVCYYLAAGGISKSEHLFTRNVTSWKYSQPQKGGQFAMNLSYLTKYKGIVCNMTKVKYNSALLALEIGREFQSQIQEEALSNALSDIERCKSMTLQCGTKDKSVLVQLLAAQNHYTLVAYPVSYHFDIFKKGEHSLENKTCFCFNLYDDHINVGRGGSGHTKFVFALLDWTNSKSGAARRLQYQITGGELKVNERLTDQKWKSHFGCK